MNQKTKLLKEWMEKRILVLDGAMGTMIQKFNLEEVDFRGFDWTNHPKELKGLNDLLSLTQPEIIKGIHEAFLRSGSHIIETNTFNANRISLMDYGMEREAKRINYISAQIAREVVNKYQTEEHPRWVAGSMGPTSKASSVAYDTNDPAKRAVSFDELVETYREQIDGLYEGGVDLFLVETIMDPLNAKAALFALQTFFEEKNNYLPVMISCTIDQKGKLLSGHHWEAFWNAVSHIKPIAFGFNCSLGSDIMYVFLKELSEKVACPVICYPNAGLPNAFGGYDETPESMGKWIRQFASEGLINIVGGCCGTTPDHIGAIAKCIEGISPRVLPKVDAKMRLSGTEPWEISNDLGFVNIGERTNVTGSKKFARLIRSQDFDAALEVAGSQVDNGASIIDINMDDSMLDSRKSMTNFLNLVALEDVARVPVMIDSSDWSVIEAGLKCVGSKGVVNSISLKEGEDVFKQEAKFIFKMGFAVVVMAFDERGQAETVERKVEICSRSFRILTEIGFAPEDIIFDLNVFAIGTGIPEHNNFAVNFIEATKNLKELFPLSHVSGGISNLSFSFRGNNEIREAMHSVFIYHAIRAGMDFGIVNPGQIPAYEEIAADLRECVEDLVLNRTTDATEKLLILAEGLKGSKTVKEAEALEWRQLQPIERLKHALVKGITRHLEEDLDEILPLYPSPLEIIGGPLMGGMNEVGVLFGEGKLFLPQVIKSARVMKRAVEYLKPSLEKDKGAIPSKKRGTILLATVKGDVHDIGKNIVELVLQCNDYEVINLGEMVSAHVIVEKALESGADIVGLSGLITPSLEEMTKVAKEMDRQSLKVPLLIGGATTSKVHTAVKIAPNYQGISVHVKDASQVIPIVNSLLSEQSKPFTDSLRKEYASMQADYKKKQEQKELLSFSEAKNQRMAINWSVEEIVAPAFLSSRVVGTTPACLADYIDWSEFFHEWKIPGNYPEIFSHPERGKEAKQLYDDALSLLKQIDSHSWVKLEGVVGFFPANTEGEDIQVYNPSEPDKVLGVFHMLRQQMKRPAGKFNLCLSDFIAPKNCSKKDFLGLFVVSCHPFLDSLPFDKKGDDYEFLLFKFLCNRLVEAFSQFLFQKVRCEFWRFSGGIHPAPGYPSCPDHSEKRLIFDLLDASNKIHVNLTDHFMMVPESSVCGFYFANPKAQYFGLGKIGNDQVKEYAKRKSIPLEEAESLLQFVLGYDVSEKKQPETGN